MNKIFKVVWSRVKHCYVVTSEMAKSTGRSKSSVGTAKIAAMACAVALTIAGGETQVAAWTLQGPGMPSSGRVINDGNRLEVQHGSGTTAVLSAGNTSTMRFNINQEAVTVDEATGGVTSRTDGTNIAFATAREVSKAIANSGFTLDVNVIEQGRDNVERAGNTVINPGEKLTITAAGLSNVEYVEDENGAGIRINTNATPIKVGSNGKVTYDGDDIDPETAGNQAVTAGDVINVINNSGWYTNAVGSNITGSATKTLIKPGGTVNFEAGAGLKIQQSVNTSTNTVTYRFDATSTGSASGSSDNIYFHVNGNTRNGTGNAETNAGKLGDEGGATRNGAIAAGINARAHSAGSIAFGTDAIARNSTPGVFGAGSIAIGTKATVDGSTAPVNGVEYGKTSIAIGTNAIASRVVTNGAISDDDSRYATNSGGLTGTSANNNQSIMYLAGMLGDTKATNDATAIGSDARAVGDQSIAIGAQVVAGHASVAIGGNDMASITTDNLATYKKITGKDLPPNTQGTGRNEIYPTTSAMEGSVAIGQKAFSRTLMGTAIGTTAFVNEGAELSTAIGTAARVGTVDGNVSSEGSTAIGAGAIVEGDHSTVVGTGSMVQATDSVGIGYKNTVTGNNSAALGININLTTDNSVVLGSNSDGSAQATTETTATVPMTDGSNFTYGGFAGFPTSTGHYVSVGAANAERQIKHVAAGKVSADSTDAINGSQLYATMAKAVQTGLNFTGNNESTINHRDLGQTLKIQGEGTQEVTKADGTTEMQTSTGKTFVSAKGNIVVEADGTDILTVKLNKDLQHINTISNGGSTLTLNATPGTDAAGNTTPAVQISGGDLDMGGNKISNLKPGTASTDAATVGQLTTVRSDNKSITVTDDNVDTDGNIIDPTKGHVYNIEVNNQSVVENAQTPVVYTDAAGNKVYKQADGTFNTAIDGTGTVVQPGNVIASMNDGSNSTTAPMILNNVGSAIEGKDGDTFLDKLNNAADGTTGTPNAAVNVSDLKHTADGLTAKGLNFIGNNESTTNHRDLGQTLKIQGEGTQEVTKADGTTEMQTSTGKTFVSAKDNIVVEADGADTLTVKLAKDLQHINTITNGGSSITLNDNPGSIDANGNPVPAVKISGGDLDMGGNKISNLKPGTASTDAATVGQLTTVTSPNKTISVVDTNLNADGTFKDSSKGHTYEIEVNSQSVVNNAQTPVVYTDAAGNKVYKQADGTFNTAVDGTGTVVQPGNVIASMNDGSNSTTAPMILNNVGSAIEGKDGDTFLDKLDNAADGTTGTPNAAVNVSDLKHTADGLTVKGLNFTADNTIASDTNTTVHRDLGKTLKIEGDGNIKTTADNKNAKISVGLNKDVTLGKVTDPTTPGEDGSLTVTGTAGNTVAINGGDGSINMAGPNNSNAISIKPSEGPATLDGTPDANGNTPNISRITYDRMEPVLDADGNPVLDAEGNPQTKTVTETVATMNDGLRFTGNNTDTVNNHKLNTLVKVQGEGVDTVASANFQSAAGNINVKANGTDTLEVQLSKNLQGINTITNGGSSITLNENPGAHTPAVSINGGNLSMGGNKITNVAPGTEKTDAATVAQLPQVTSSNDSVRVIESVNEDGAKVYDLAVDTVSPAVVNELADEIGRVGAQGAALAALKPIQYDPLEPTQIMAGYGNYRGNSALALGVAHYKNESTMIHGGVSWATGDGRHMMANAGITWKVGSRDSEAAIADRYRKGPISSAYALQNEVAAMKAENTGLKGEVANLKAENQEMKAENQEMKAQIAMLMQRLGL